MRRYFWAGLICGVWRARREGSKGRRTGAGRGLCRGLGGADNAAAQRAWRRLPSVRARPLGVARIHRRLWKIMRSQVTFAAPGAF